MYVYFIKKFVVVVFDSSFMELVYVVLVSFMCVIFCI